MRLFIDDLRVPPSEDFIVARTSIEAIEAVKHHGWPTFISFDHDLGGEDTAMVFLRMLVNLRQGQPIPDYIIHSANPVGSLNILSFMESWKRSTTLE